MNPATILIVDDEASLRRSTSLLLQQQGYAVESATSGKEGWEKVNNIRPNLVLLDIRLADMDGRELCRRIKAESSLQKVFVILISGVLVTPEDQIAGFEAGADSYLNRPLQNGVLLAHIEALLRIRRREIALEEKDRELDEARRLTSRIMAEADIQRRGATEARRQLEESSQKLRMLSRTIEESPVSVVITGASGLIEYVNPHFTKTTGYTSEEVVGKHTRIRKSGQHTAEFYKEMWMSLLAGQMWKGEICNRKRNGLLHWESAAISPVRDPAGKITHFVAIFEDITKRKQIDAELHEAKDAAEAANRAKSAFLAHMSHEIRTPMNAILGYSQLLERDPSLSESATESLRIINRSGEHLLKLIDDVLEMSKIEAGRVSLDTGTFDLPDLLADIGSMFRLRTEAKKLAFEIINRGDIPGRIQSDQGKLRQVLVNLLGNAIKFTERGSIVLRVSARKEPPRRIWLSMEVEDTGKGIAEEELRKLFSFFEQTASGRHLRVGTGLGLAISREYVRLMGGEITVESQWNKGSTFRVEIPVEEGTTSPAPENGALRRVIGIQPDQKPVRVLVADSDLASRDWVIKLLLTVGFEVREATNGEEAVRQWQHWSPQAILMGLNMSGLNGCDATRAIRALPCGEKPAIFAVTASVFGETRDAALEAGVNAFLPKPLKEAELFEAIRNTLHLEYLYAYAEDRREPAPAVLIKPDDQPKTLEKIPRTLLNSMRCATENGDMDQLRKLIEKAEQCDAAFGLHLRELADQYEFDALFHLLAEATA